MAATIGPDSTKPMLFPRQISLVLAAAAVIAPALAAEPAERQFEALAAVPQAGLGGVAGQALEVDVDLAASPGFSIELHGERAEVRYRMAFNQIAEGWSWQPQADPAVEDYYQYKFLPLQSLAVERGSYEFEDKIGEPQQMKVIWRYDYFLAFANLYDFYPRTVDDDAGFTADLPAAVVPHLGIRVHAHLVAPVLSESTTFWKASYGKPTDFTLKKRYLMAALDEVDFIDTGSGRVLCRVVPGQAHCAAR